MNSHHKCSSLIQSGTAFTHVSSSALFCCRFTVHSLSSFAGHCLRSSLRRIANTYATPHNRKSNAVYQAIYHGYLCQNSRYDATGRAGFGFVVSAMLLRIMPAHGCKQQSGRQWSGHKRTHTIPHSEMAQNATRPLCCCVCPVTKFFGSERGALAPVL